MTENFTTWLDSLPPLAGQFSALAILLVIAVIADVIVGRILLRVVRETARRTASTWDDTLVEFKVFARLTRIVPALVLTFGIHLVPGIADLWVEVVTNLAQAFIALMVTLAVSSLLSAGNAIYSQHPVSRERPIKGFVQVAKIVVYILGGVIIVSVLISKSPVVLLTGFGAMTAILLLIFRDTILSLVASVQMASLDMVRVGDWIEMPRFNADGDVIDVALHTVKVQNWDKTITTIPTHTLISESFRNWRGMQESGGRRVKRSVNIDVNSVRYLDEDELKKFKGFKLLQDYIAQKEEELADYNARLGETSNVNLRRLTNLGTFRAYLKNYLHNHPRIHQEMTLLVRQLQPADSGMPIEIYCFTNTTNWAEYEDIQADIFDHILAQCREFGLNVFQSPTGSDFRLLKPGGS